MSHSPQSLEWWEVVLEVSSTIHPLDLGYPRKFLPSCRKHWFLSQVALSLARKELQNFLSFYLVSSPFPLLIGVLAFHKSVILEYCTFFKNMTCCFSFSVAAWRLQCISPFLLDNAISASLLAVILGITSFRKPLVRMWWCSLVLLAHDIPIIVYVMWYSSTSRDSNKHVMSTQCG